MKVTEVTMTEARNEPNEYRLSFTVGGLFLHEVIATGQVWEDSQDWRQVRSLPPSNLFVAAGVASSAKRLRNEVIRRLQTLEEAELFYLAHCPIVEREEKAAYGGKYRFCELCLTYTNALAAGNTDAEIKS